MITIDFNQIVIKKEFELSNIKLLLSYWVIVMRDKLSSLINARKKFHTNEYVSNERIFANDVLENFPGKRIVCHFDCFFS